MNYVTKILTNLHRKKKTFELERKGQENGRHK